MRSLSSTSVALQLKLQGLTYARIGVQLGLSEAGVHLAIRRGLAALAATTRHEAERYLAVELARCEAVRAHTFELEAIYRQTLRTIEPHLTRIEKTADTATGQGTRRVRRLNVAAVEKHRLVVDSLARLDEIRLKCSERVSRLLGLDASPKKTADDDPNETGSYMGVLVSIWQEKARQNGGPPAMIETHAVAEDPTPSTNGSGAPSVGDRSGS